MRFLIQVRLYSLKQLCPKLKQKVTTPGLAEAEIVLFRLEIGTIRRQSGARLKLASALPHALYRYAFISTRIASKGLALKFVGRCSNASSKQMISPAFPMMSRFSPLGR